MSSRPSHVPPVDPERRARLIGPPFFVERNGKILVVNQPSQSELRDRYRRGQALRFVEKMVQLHIKGVHVEAADWQPITVYPSDTVYDPQPGDRVDIKWGDTHEHTVTTTLFWGRHDAWVKKKPDGAQSQRRFTFDLHCQGPICDAVHSMPFS